MSVSTEDGTELPVDSFWEISQYKRTVSRIDNGMKLCDDLMSFTKERANIEEQYSKALKSWSTRFRKTIEKNSSYNTLEQSWLGSLNEAERCAQLHTKVKDNLMTDTYEKIKHWKKENYHSLTLGGIKESKVTNDEFARAQKQWAKYYKKVQDAKKNYFNICKEERSAQIQSDTAKSDSAVAPEKVKKLAELVEKKTADKSKLRTKYENTLREVQDDTPRYMEDMEKVFQKTQDFERSRLEFFKEAFLSIHQHLDLSNVPEYTTIYSDLRSCLEDMNSESDLRWWRTNHGPDMPMQWPEFEDYNPDRLHANKSLNRKAGSKVKSHVDIDDGGVQGKSASFTPTYESTNNGGVTNTNEWSDDEGTNPFNEETNYNNDGVLVTALYDYNGQEEDELTFAAGEKLYKLRDEDEQGWCEGKLMNGRTGLYPANYVE